jgi:hypothetical protein
MMLVVGPTGVGDRLGWGLGDGDGAPVPPVAPTGVGDRLGLGLGDGEGAPLAPVAPVAPTGVEGLGSGLGDEEGAPVAPLAPPGPLGPVDPVLEVVDVPLISPDATAGTTM